MGLIQLVEDVREAQQVSGGQEGHREGGMPNAGRLERPRKDRLRQQQQRIRYKWRPSESGRRTHTAA